MTPTLYTCGHGTLTLDELIALLRGATIETVVDVRTVPASRTNPQFNRDTLSTSLPAAGVAYRWEKRLGGFRKPRLDSPNGFWRHPSFRGYADYMQTVEFWEALDSVIGEANNRPTVVMCSESVWWRCHRRLIADAAVLARGVPVLHLFHDGRLASHEPTKSAQFNGSTLIYSAPPDPLRLVPQQQ